MKKTLVKRWLKAGLITDQALLKAFEKVQREDFMLPEYMESAYMDTALPILANQTISQPTTVMIMIQALELKETEKVLEIGSGSGYNAALMAEMVKKGRIYTLEIISELADFAKKNLQPYGNVEVILSDGSIGLKEKAPFDKIIITAASPRIPDTLLKQLKIDGIMVVPVGSQFHQEMLVIRKRKEKLDIKNLGSFMFVPMKGKEGY
ncbi:MAG TPA: protein-L-isoaspartate(D-aspartate) O-methyltransferase [Candidatus Nanoarchaeia archaeon]|nr:protein-L-isoaspartate(D-aspartate) O-methyltransferase [Candidatus Nanoarchaeia archaeon]